jgi:DNA-binding Lrp family transcriptional regulator
VGKKLNQKAELDNIDTLILSVLKENCHLSLRKLAGKIDISDVVAVSRIKKLEDTGILKGYTVILEPVKLGFDLTAIIFIQTEGGTFRIWRTSSHKCLMLLLSMKLLVILMLLRWLSLRIEIA